jgi:hypothetical protein
VLESLLLMLTAAIEFLVLLITFMDRLGPLSTLIGRRGTKPRSVIELMHM